MIDYKKNQKKLDKENFTCYSLWDYKQQKHDFAERNIT
jgi:hypothetical protein